MGIDMINVGAFVLFVFAMLVWGALTWLTSKTRTRRIARIQRQRHYKAAAQRLRDAQDAPASVSVGDYYAICKDTNLDIDPELGLNEDQAAAHRAATRAFRHHAARCMECGYISAEIGYPRDTNPWDEGTAFYQRWDKGWCSKHGINPKTNQTADEWRDSEAAARAAQRDRNRAAQKA